MLKNLFKFLLILMFTSPLLAQSIPSMVLVNGQVYTVVKHRGTIKDGKDNDDGLTSCKAKTIWVNVDDTPDDIADTLLHEIQHALTNCEDELSSTHHWIYEMTPKLLKLLHENPDLEKFLMHPKKEN